MNRNSLDIIFTIISVISLYNKIRVCTQNIALEINMTSDALFLNINNAFTSQEKNVYYEEHRQTFSHVHKHKEYFLFFMSRTCINKPWRHVY